jgi:hypothetical protein
MSKKKIEELMQRRSPISREAVKPIDFFNLQTANQEEDKTAKLQTGKPVNQFAVKDESNNSEEDKKIEEKEISKQETTLVKYTTYLPEELITKIKIQAALQRKKGYQIIQQALEKFFEKS